MALGAKQLRLVAECFIEAIGTCVAVLAGVAFITVALAVALARAVAFADAILRAVSAGLAVLPVVALRTTNLQRVDAEPAEEI